MKTGPAFPLTRDEDRITPRRLLGGLAALVAFVGVFWVLAAAGF